MTTKEYKPFYSWVLVTSVLPFSDLSFFSAGWTGHSVTFTMYVLSAVNKCCTFCDSSVLHNALTYQSAI